MKKKAEDLKPGDVVKFDGACYAFQYVSSAPPSSHMGPDHRLYSFAGLGERFNSQPGIDRVPRWMPPDMPIEVESPALTLAQQHSEELVEMVRWALEGKTTSWDVSAVALLKRIDPPKPPSAEEALAMLAAVMDAVVIGIDPIEAGYREKSALALLDRARAAGMLKGDK